MAFGTPGLRGYFGEVQAALRTSTAVRCPTTEKDSTCQTAEGTRHRRDSLCGRAHVRGRPLPFRSRAALPQGSGWHRPPPPPPARYADQIPVISHSILVSALSGAEGSPARTRRPWRRPTSLPSWRTAGSTRTARACRPPPGRPPGRTCSRRGLQAPCLPRYRGQREAQPTARGARGPARPPPHETTGPWRFGCRSQIRPGPQSRSACAGRPDRLRAMSAGRRRG